MVKSSRSTGTAKTKPCQVLLAEALESYEDKTWPEQGVEVVTGQSWCCFADVSFA